jgi:hypothetical protein
LFGYSPKTQFKSRETAIDLANVINFKALKDLALGAAREELGPHSDRPYLAIDLADTDESLAPWLRDLPCPIIGIGDGAMGPACDVVLSDENKLAVLTGNITKAPITAMVLVQHLRASEHLSMTDALTAESFAYATVQKGPEFLNWHPNQNPEPAKKIGNPIPLSITTNGTVLELVMNDTERLNAIGINMRDALCEALDLALLNHEFTKITLTGKGRVFSTGGDVSEFGEVSDPAIAHWVRSLRLPAWRLARLQDRLHVHINGAAIGAGAEIAAFASRVTASPKAWFQLPELKYGLIPGAGGTASIPRRIGRQRTAYMALSMEKIRAKTALDWGLIDAVID